MARSYQGAPGATAQAQLPQTTVSNGNFVESSRSSARPGYLSSVAWGGMITQPLAAAPGYLTSFDVSIYASGGAQGSAANTAFNTAGSAGGAFGSAASIWAGSILDFTQVKASNGPPIYSISDPLGNYLINLLSGQVGVMQAADPTKWPSYSAIATAAGTAGTGNFLARFRIPFEITPGFGALAIGNASLQPSLQFNVASSSSVFSTAPSTLPALNFEVDLNYLAAVPGQEPPGLGTTMQWTQLNANPTIPSGASQRVQLGRTSGWLTTLILLFRDSQNNAIDYGWPGGTQSSTTSPFGNPASIGKRLRLYVDGIPVIDEDINARMDKMFEAYPGIAVNSNRLGPSGAVGWIAYTFRNSVSQAVLGKLDTGEVWLPTTPGSLLELEGTPWGSFTNSGGQVIAFLGSIVGSAQRGISNVTG